MSFTYLLLVSLLLAVTAANAAIPDQLEAPARTPIAGERLEPAKPPVTPASPPLTPTRGELLYENHCTACHESVVHIRQDRRANSLRKVEYWVTRWASELKLQWGAGEVNDVVQYLNRRFYKFASPPASK